MVVGRGCHLRWRHIGTFAAGVGSHVSRGQFVPCMRKCSFQSVVVLGKHVDQFLVFRVMEKRNITCEHPNRRFVETWLDRLRQDLLRFVIGQLPLVLPSWAFELVPFVFRQHFEETVVPFHRIWGPWQLKTTGEGIFSLSRSTSTFPKVKNNNHC